MELTADAQDSVRNLAVALDEAVDIHLRVLDETAAGELSAALRTEVLDVVLSIAITLRSIQRRAASLTGLGPPLDLGVPMTVLWTLQNSLLVLYDVEIGDELALSRLEFDALVGVRPLQEWVAAAERNVRAGP